MFHYGVDYYPEQWPEGRWAEDARLMREAHFSVVRLAEFAWAKLEPEPGRFDFDWLDRAIEILATEGLAVVLGTPTASPPAWLMHQHPELFRVRSDGLALTYGNRREYCPNQPLYRELSRAITSRMAEHYGRHPAVIGWQIDNEFGDRCFCAVCAAAFQGWLQARYISLDDLNEKWGTIFWSHTYTDWAQIPLPLTTGGSPNPSLALEFARFSSASYVAFQKEQIDLLRATCPHQFITHNLMGFRYDQIDYFDLARDLDVVSWDDYPRFRRSETLALDPSGMALGAATMRSLKRRNFWVMEQQAGPAGWETVGASPRPGELRLWALQQVAHGADAILFFRWRTARFGTEQYWHGLLDHHGRVGRRYGEVQRLGKELKRLGPLVAGAEVRARVAMVLSYDARFAFQIQPNNPRFDYAAHFATVFRAFHAAGVAIDIVSPADDLSGYALVIAPALHVVAPSAARRLTDFVAQGGVLVLTQRSGVKDNVNAVVDQPLPGLLAELCGAEVEEYDSCALDVYNALEFTEPAFGLSGNPTVGTWCDILRPVSAQVVARYTQDYYAGKPAITLNRFGQGQAMYIGTVGDDALYRGLARFLLERAGLMPPLEATEGLEVAERWQAERRLLFVLNHTDQPRLLRLDGPCSDVLNGDEFAGGMVTVNPRDCVVLAAP